MNKWERGEYKNPYLLLFNKKEENKFMWAVKKADITLFKAITIITIFFTILFIIIDFQRVQERYYLVAILRGSVLLLFTITYFIISYRNIAPKLLQKLIIGCLLFICLTFFLLDYLVPMPQFLLSNALVTIGFFGITISGLRFRNGLVLELSFASVFIPYSLLITHNDYLASQIPNLLTNICLGILCGYTLERVRRTAYLRNEKIVSQNTVIRGKNNKLRDLINAKNKLISILSHDLRSPMKSLKSLLDMKLSGDINADEFDSYAKQIYSRIDLTENLIENLLVWAKSQISSDFLKPYPFSMKEITGKNIEFFKENAAEKNIRLSIAASEDTIVNAHQESINMVIRNLISNSLKFTPNGGSIDISFQSNGKYAEFQISDTGVGIPEKNMSKIFSYENFTTLGTKKEKGTGLGLAICQDFIVKNKGKIWVEQNKDVGCTFKFKIPLLKT